MGALNIKIETPLELYAMAHNFFLMNAQGGVDIAKMRNDVKDMAKSPGLNKASLAVSLLGVATSLADFMKIPENTKIISRKTFNVVALSGGGLKLGGDIMKAGYELHEQGYISDGILADMSSDLLSIGATRLAIAAATAAVGAASTPVLVTAALLAGTLALGLSIYSLAQSGTPETENHTIFNAFSDAIARLSKDSPKMTTGQTSFNIGVYNQLRGVSFGVNPYGCADPRIPIRFDIKSSLLFNNLSTFPQRTDPFTLDLDDDGIETVGINSTVPLMFDLDDSGIKKSVGWIAADDGLLVWDRNGNGMIDSGAELFGDATPRYDADGVLLGRAVDGFAALAQEDSNADGNVDRLDAHWSALRVWQDANQDGVSQGVELKTLDELGIVSIHVSKTENSSLLANGNVLADLGTYTRSDGRQGSAAVTAALADVDLAVDTFHSQFTDAIPLTEQAQTLPGMQGSGQVRSLREAASLPTPAGAALAALLLQFSQATSRSAQQALIDPLIKAWADTSAMATTFDGAYAGRELTVDMQVRFHPTLYAGSPDYQAMADKLSIVERFNGRLYQPIPQGDGPVALTLWHNPQLLLQKSYDALKTSVYESLTLQTRLSPLLDSIEFSVSDNGVEMDFSRTAAQLTARLAANPADGLGDLLDFNRATRTMLQGSAWNGDALLTSYLRSQPPSAELQTLLAENGIRIKGHAGWSGDGGSGDDIVVGDAADDTLYGNGGNGGDDMLDGDGGQDLLVGGAGNDTYLFRRGSGHDRINAYDTAQERIKTLVLDGLNGGDIRAEKWGKYDLRADPSRQRRLLCLAENCVH